jgi:hypothetical protein
LDGETLPAAITHTFVNGNCIYSFPALREIGEWDESFRGERLIFN